MIKNLSQLKKYCANRPYFEIVAHCRPECIGQIRKVNVVDTTGFYSIIPDDPNAKATLANHGKGSFLGWSKAPFWKFENDVASVYSSDKKTDDSLILSMAFKLM